MFKLSEVAGGGVVLDTWMVDHDGRGVAGPARELAYLDAQGGRPLGFAGRATRPQRPPVRAGALRPRVTAMPSPARALLGAFFVCAGLLHFIKPRPYVSIMPSALPAHLELVYASGVGGDRRRRGRAVGADRALGGLVADRGDGRRVPRQREHGGEAERFDSIPEPLLWARLPLQAVVIAWIWRVAIRRPGA